MAGLKIENLSKTFGAQTVLDDFSLELAENELLVVLGPSGCGKSTLLRLISGLETADRGKIVLDGRDITKMEPQKRKTAMVFQNYALYPHMTVFDNIAFPLKVAKISRAEIKSTVQKTAELLELENYLDRRPAQLSGGQRQRVALGRGLVRQPSIFLLDEPLSNLDAALRVKMRQEIVALQKRVGITMIYVTHDQTEALTMADRMVVLKDGRIHQHGTPGEVYNDPQDSFVASFIGTPGINLFDEIISGGRGQALPLQFDNSIKDGHYTIGVRPEHIRLEPEGPLTGELLGVEYIGAVSHLSLRFGDLTLTVIDNRPEKKYRAGDLIPTRIDLDRIFLFDRDSGRRL
ncbi:MAG: ABC transporter ATP-binding protein [FCB group bacterium]|nr:ABC transporter ATP-binding protein [FCB group bacterium]